MRKLHRELWRSVVCAAGLLACAAGLPAQQLNGPQVIQGIDAAVKARMDGVESYIVTEHYAVFRGKDQVHPIAEMTVKTTYSRESGKSYQVLSQSGSALVQKMVFGTLLDNEKRINLPENRAASWLTSANYEMKLKSPAIERLNGRDCYTLDIFPHQKAPNLVEGTLWVDTKNFQVAQILGVASKSPSIFAGVTQMMRQYNLIDGFAMATQARAVSQSLLLGQTVVTIDYRDYQLQLRPTN